MHWTPKVACKRNGDFIITWSDSDEGSFKDAPGEIHKNGNHSLWSNPQGSKSYEPDVYAQMYAADGSPLGENFMVNNETGFSFQMDPAITVDSAGNFIIAWEDNRYNEYDIFFQRYAGDGTPLGGNVRAEGSQYSEFQFNPTIASDPAGNFIIAWSDQRNGDSDIYGQRYSNAGSPIDENFLVNTDSSFTQQSFPCISVAPNGNFIISWTDRRNGNDDVYAQRYLADGTPFGNNYMISNTGQLDQTFPAVTLGESLIFTAWQDNRDGQMGFNIWANVMDWDFTVGIENNPAAEISPLPYLHQNYPNPFSHSTIIRFDLPEVAKVKIEIFNHFGQKIETLLDKPMPAGLHEVDFSAGNLPGGVYLYKIIANSNEESFELIQVKKMVVVK